MNEEIMSEMFKIFIDLGIDGLAMNHYELAQHTKIKDPLLWRTFLMEPKIKEHIATETALVRNAELNKITQDIGTSHSVGQAQIISSLSKLSEKEHVKQSEASDSGGTSSQSALGIQRLFRQPSFQ